jgi:chromosome partitioning protein
VERPIFISGGESHMAKIIAVANQKGGVGKTTTCANLGIGLARSGKKVLLIDDDAQGSLTASLGWQQPDQLDETLASVMGKMMEDRPIDSQEGILHHAEGVDLMPANIELSGMEVSLVNAMSRETVLRQYLENVKHSYNYVLIDCMPSLGMLTVNALAAADSVLIPVQAEYLPVKGLEQLLRTIAKVRRQINPHLKIEGILLTMVNERTNYAKDIISLLHETYGGKMKIFDNTIPLSVRAAEISAEGTSIYAHDPHGKVAQAYESLTREVLKIEKQRQKYKADLIR